MIIPDVISYAWVWRCAKCRGATMLKMYGNGSRAEEYRRTAELMPFADAREVMCCQCSDGTCEP